MGKREKIRNFVIVLIIAISIILFLNYVIRIDIKVLGIIGTIIVVMIPSSLSFLTSNKTNEIVNKLSDEVSSLKDDTKIIKELFSHKKDIVSLSQQVEMDTSNAFDEVAEINVMLRDYIVGVNDVITDIITKQYAYDFDLFDPKYFKTKILNKVNHLNLDINYVMINENCFEKISDKVILNIKAYITELKYVKDLENGKRRNEFKELTLSLTRKITSHSIDIYREYKKTA